MLCVQRARLGLTDRVRTYRILLDGERVGRIRNGETVRIEIAPGAHEVQLRVDWASSRRVAIEARDGATVHLLCQPNTHPFVALAATLLLPRRCIRLEPVPDGGVPAVVELLPAVV